MKPLTTSQPIINKFSITHYITLFCVFSPYFVQIRSKHYFCNRYTFFGIPHGANDIKILVKKNSTSKPLLKFFYLISYVTVVLLGVSIFYFLPALGLVTFISVSCYHFGEQHWESKLNNIKERKIFFLTYGALIFSILFIFHYKSINEIIFQISSYDLSYLDLKKFLFSQRFLCCA